METTVSLPGRKIEKPSVEPGLEDFIKVRVVEATEVDFAVRGTDKEESVEVEKAQSDDIVEIEYDDNFKLWTSVTDLQDGIKRVKPENVGPRSLKIPSTLEREAETRGLEELKEFAIKKIKLLRLDPIDLITEGIGEVGAKSLAELGAKAIARHFESKLKPGPGLYRITNFDKIEEKEKIEKATDLKIDNPYLLFIHGTGSCCADAFGRITANDDGKDWEKLRTRYGDSILAFDHYSLSEGPIKNALDLAKNLPKQATLHLVGHSRGGLVGDLLCLPPNSKKDFEELVAPFKEREESRDEDIELLKEFVAELARKQFKIERFVRVASPSRGTVLLSRRLDIYFSILLNAIGLIPILQTSLTYNFLKATLLALVKQRAEPDELPGLEAQMPSSPLINMLNDPRWKTDADLAVIAGDIAGEGFLGKLKALAVYAYFLEENDLVVDTDSMSEGLHRDKAVVFSEEGKDVNHFNYFANDSSRTKLVNWLTESGKAKEEGFQELKREAVERVVPVVTRSTADLPVVFVLPGVMGSHLKVGDERIWISIKELIRGGLDRLEINDDGITPDGLVANYYQKLVDYLQSSYEVIPFDYDWRKPIGDSGDLLAGKVKEQLKKHEKPIRFIAHSMGGLVVRAMIANYKELWEELSDERDARLIMLGTPNLGSYAIPQMLLGREKLLKMLALADYKHKIGDLISIVRNYPGILDLLPEEFFESKRWSDLKGAKAPATVLLKRAKEMRAKLAADAVDKERMVYVAGSSSNTPCGVKVTADGVVFIGTQLGDGRVTYDLGLLPGVQAFYTDTVHGDMADRTRDFPAFAEILDSGKTSKLRDAPAVSRGEDVLRELRDEEVALFPTETELAAAALGSGVKRRKAKDAYKIQVSVVHGDLRFAEYPVAVGHYQEDTIVSAEAYLDRQLKGRLSERHRLNLYPGAVGTAEIIHGDEIARPPGALIIGLGEVGEITLDKVRQGVTNAVLRYALEIAEQAKRENAKTWRPVSFSTLLIGTYGGNALTVESSVSAIIQGAIQANRALREQKLWEKYVRVDKIELIELFQDSAVEAMHAAHQVADHPPIELEDTEGIEVSPNYLRTQPGRRYHRPYDQYRTGWWRRIQVTGVSEDRGQDSRPGSYLGGSARFRKDTWFQDAQRDFIEKLVTEAVRSPEQRIQIAAMLEDYFNQGDFRENLEGDLRFLNLTDMARVEDTLQATQRALIEQMVAKVVDPSKYDEKLAVALFELLIPNTIKEQMQIQADLVLVLDSESAQYPWEMLAKKTSGGIRPVSQRMGIIRQFKTAEFRHNPQYSRSKNVLVIGDTESGFAELSGAQEEAKKVDKLLCARDFDTKKMIRPLPSDVMGELFARDYRILHLAAHGIYDADNPKRSGMVLGNGMFLTAAELTNLRVLPELVFINCCHLGSIDRKPRVESPGKLAASVAEELIKAGVRAVVAAGWAVNDDAASTFATEFYKAMLGDYGGERVSFGKAVLWARQKTFKAHSSFNTWGAYQCYGNPGFTLSQPSQSEKPKPDPIYSRSEYIGRLSSISSQTRHEPVKNDDLIKTLVEFREKIPESFLDGEILYEFGEAWVALKDYEKAIGFYEQAILEQGAKAPLRVIERLANFQVRHAETLLESESGSKQKKSDMRKSGSRNQLPPKVEELFSSAECRLKLLLKLGESHERYSLLARVYKARAKVSRQISKLRTAEKYYEEAYRWHIKAKGIPDFYSSLNWITCRFLLGETRQKGVKEELLKDIEECQKVIEKRLKEEPDFWYRAGRADFALIEHLVKGDLNEKIEKDDNKDKKKDKTYNDLVLEHYRWAFEFGPSASEMDSVIKQIEFIIEILEIRRPQARKAKPARPTVTGETIKALKEILQELKPH